MATFGDFDASTTAPQTEFQPLPVAKYLAMIIDSKEKPTRNAQRLSDGSFSESYIEFTFEVIDGPYKGRRLWSRLNLKNKSAEAVKIARSELSAICHAVKVLRAKESIELHNLPLVVSVKCKKRQDSDEMTNVIRNYEPKENYQPGNQLPTAGNQSAPPWARTTAA